MTAKRQANREPALRDRVWYNPELRETQTFHGAPDSTVTSTT